eukprot:COSAG02_NODE_41183_length_397_cov_0.848993_1_plen_108_part_10
MVYSEQRGTGTQIPVSAPSSLRSKLEKRLQSSYGTSGRKAFEGYASEHKAFELPWMVTASNASYKNSNRVSSQGGNLDKFSSQNSITKSVDCSILPHEIKKEQLQKNT